MRVFLPNFWTFLQSRLLAGGEVYFEGWNATYETLTVCLVLSLSYGEWKNWAAGWSLSSKTNLNPSFIHLQHISPIQTSSSISPVRHTSCVGAMTGAHYHQQFSNQADYPFASMVAIFESAGRTPKCSCGGCTDHNSFFLSDYNVVNPVCLSL